MIGSAESAALALSVFGMSLAIVGIAIAIQIYNKQSKDDEQLRDLIGDIGNVTKNMGDLTASQTNMIKEMSTLTNEENKRYQSRKNDQEEQCVHELVELRKQILLIAVSIANSQIITVADIQNIWNPIPSKKYLDELIKTGFDVLEIDVKKKLRLLKAELDRDISSDFDLEITVIGQLSSIIDSLLQEELRSTRLKIIDRQNETVREIIERRKSQHLNEKTYASEIIYQRTLQDPYRFGGESPFPLLDSKK